MFSFAGAVCPILPERTARGRTPAPYPRTLRQTAGLQHHLTR